MVGALEDGAGVDGALGAAADIAGAAGGVTGGVEVGALAALPAAALGCIGPGSDAGPESPPQLRLVHNASTAIGRAAGFVHMTRPSARVASQAWILSQLGTLCNRGAVQVQTHD
jgi:hypothetical protein